MASPVNVTLVAAGLASVTLTVIYAVDVTVAIPGATSVTSTASLPPAPVTGRG